MHHIVLTGCDKCPDDVVSHCRSVLHSINPEAMFCRLSGGCGTAIAAPLDTVKSWVDLCLFATPRAHALRLLSEPTWESRYVVVAVLAVVIVPSLTAWYGCATCSVALLAGFLAIWSWRRPSWWQSPQYLARQWRWTGPR